MFLRGIHWRRGPSIAKLSSGGPPGQSRESVPGRARIFRRKPHRRLQTRRPAAMPASACASGTAPAFHQTRTWTPRHGVSSSRMDVGASLGPGKASPSQVVSRLARPPTAMPKLSVKRVSLESIRPECPTRKRQRRPRSDFNQPVSLCSMHAVESKEPTVAI